MTARLSFCLALLSLAACSGGRHGTTSEVYDGGTGADLYKSPTFMQTTVNANGAPSDSASQFTGTANSALAPKIVYPPDGVLMPPNLSELEFQWTPAGGTTLYELRFQSPAIDLTVYTPCVTVGTGCGYLPDVPTWTFLSTQTRGETVQLTVRAAGNGQVGTAATRTLSFSDEDLLGGLYYWAASDGNIVRYDFGQRNQTAEIFYGATEAGAVCVGCHALSRDGTRIAVGMNIPEPAGMRVLDVSSKNVLWNAASGSNFETFSPKGDYVLASVAGDLSLFDAMAGTQVGTTPVITNGLLPDWSADGSKVVFAQPGGAACPIPGFCGSLPGVDSGSLNVVPVTNTTTFGTPKEIVSGGGNNFYPGFSPDGNIVAFNRSASGANSFDAPDALVWAVAATGGNPVQLKNAASTAGDSWPKFAPYTHHFNSDTIFWLTFSSRRDYGLRIVNSTLQVTTDPDGTTEDPRIAQVWMVAVPADAIMNGSMPSGGYPAFWLPFQSMTSGNHIAQWVEKVAYQTCSGDAGTCPVGEYCRNGTCVGQPIQ